MYRKGGSVVDTATCKDKVSIRLNIFGFPQPPAITSTFSGNFTQLHIEQLSDICNQLSTGNISTLILHLDYFDLLVSADLFTSSLGCLPASSIPSHLKCQARRERPMGMFANASKPTKRKTSVRSRHWSTNAKPA